MKQYLLIALLFLVREPSFTQEFTVPESALEFIIEGRTKPDALRQFLRWDSERIFLDLEELGQVAEEYRRKIANTRLFDSAEYRIYTPEGLHPKLEFSVKEPSGLGFFLANTLLLPVVTYDTNTGLIAGAGYQDQNFLGNMAEFRLNGEYRNKTDGTMGGWLFGSWTIPWPNNMEPAALFLGFNLAMDFSGQSSSHLEARYRGALYPGFYSTWSVKTAFNPGSGVLTGNAGITLESVHRYSNWSSNLSGSQSLQFPEDGPDRKYINFELGSTQTWDFRQYFGFFGSSMAQWTAKLKYAFWPSVPLEDPGRKGLLFQSQPAVALDGVSWQGIFRQGGSVKLSHQITVGVLEGDIRENSAKLESRVHLQNEWTALSLRLIADYFFWGFSEEAGKEIRGLLNQSLSSYSRGIFNVDLQGRIPLGPVNQAIEVLLVPFLDGAAVWAAPESERPSGLYTGAGLEVILIPTFSKTSLIRLSLGWNTTDFPLLSPSPQEVALDLSHFY